MRLPTQLPPLYAPLAEREVVVQGRRVTYTEAGVGPPLLLVHGAVFGGNVFWWETQAALAGHFRTIAPDLPGWGASDKPKAAYDMAFYHGFLQAFQAELGLERPGLVGHSMGGILGSSYALRHPERLSSLAILASPPAWVDFRIPSLFQPFTIPVLGELVINALPWLGARSPLGIRGFYEGLFHAPREVPRERMHRAIAGCVSATTEPGHRAAVLGTMRANLDWFRPGGSAPFQAMLAGHTLPTLIVAGKQDPLFPQALLARGAAAVPGARFEVLDRCGHFPQWEQAEAVERLLVEFHQEPA